MLRAGLHPHLLNTRPRTGYCASSSHLCLSHCPFAETVAALQAFRKRHSDAQRISGQLNAQPTTVDLAHYRSVLKNKAIVDEAEKILRDFKPVTYDVGVHVKAIETFETKAVRPTFFFFVLFLLTSTTITHYSCIIGTPLSSRCFCVVDRQGQGDGSTD
jgi:hypothetical protein